MGTIANAKVTHYYNCYNGDFIGCLLIINRDYIYRINLTKQQLVMSDMALNQAFMLSASKAALKQLKQLLENELK